MKEIERGGSLGDTENSILCISVSGLCVGQIALPPTSVKQGRGRGGIYIFILQLRTLIGMHISKKILLVYVSSTQISAYNVTKLSAAGCEKRTRQLIVHYCDSPSLLFLCTLSC